MFCIRNCSPRRAFLQLCLVAGFGLCASAALAAYPDKPVKLVVPYPPGGATDVIGRIIALKLGEALGQQVIVDNRSGAGGNIGAEAVAKAPADGYTLLMGALTSHSTMATLEKGKLRYSITKDFIPVMVVGSVPLVVVVNPGLQLRALAVTTPQRISMLPDVPTTAEAGLPAVEVSSTFGVLAPAATPKDILERLNGAVARIVAMPDVKEQFLAQGVYAAAPTTPEKSAERLAQEVARWAKLIADTNIKADD